MINEQWIVKYQGHTYGPYDSKTDALQVQHMLGKGAVLEEVVTYVSLLR